MNRQISYFFLFFIFSHLEHLKLRELDIHNQALHFYTIHISLTVGRFKVRSVTDLTLNRPTSFSVLNFAKLSLDGNKFHDQFPAFQLFGKGTWHVNTNTGESDWSTRTCWRNSSWVVVENSWFPWQFISGWVTLSPQLICFLWQTLDFVE